MQYSQNSVNKNIFFQDDSDRDYMEKMLMSPDSRNLVSKVLLHHKTEMDVIEEDSFTLAP